MTITLTNRASASANGATAATRTTSSFTPGASRNLYVFVTGGTDFGIHGLDITHVSNTAGLTFTRLTSSAFNIGGGGGDIGSALFEATVGSSPAAMTITFDVGSVNGWLAYGIFDAVGSVGTVGLKSGQIATANETDGGGATETHTTGTLPGSATSGNPTVLMVGKQNDGNGLITAPSGFSTTLFDTGNTQFFAVAGLVNTGFTGTSVTVTDLGTTINCSTSILAELEETVSATAADNTRRRPYRRPAPFIFRGFR